MKLSFWIKRGVCAACAVITALSFSACGCSKHKSAKTNAASNVGRVTSEGYELPYTYPDGYVAVAKIVDNSTYKTVETTGLKNTRYWLTTTQTKKEVEDFYAAYFKELQPVQPKQKGDSSVAYYDKEKRIIISNLTVWEADDGVNYKFGIEPCEDLSKSEVWQAAPNTPASTAAPNASAPATKAPATTAPATTAAHS